MASIDRGNVSVSRKIRTGMGSEKIFNVRWEIAFDPTLDIEEQTNAELDRLEKVIDVHADRAQRETHG